MRGFSCNFSWTSIHSFNSNSQQKKHADKTRLDADTCISVSSHIVLPIFFLRPDFLYGDCDDQVASYSHMASAVDVEGPGESPVAFMAVLGKEGMILWCCSMRGSKHGREV